MRHLASTLATLLALPLAGHGQNMSPPPVGLPAPGTVVVPATPAPPAAPAQPAQPEVPTLPGAVLNAEPGGGSGATGGGTMGPNAGRVVPGGASNAFGGGTSGPFAGTAPTTGGLVLLTPGGFLFFGGAPPVVPGTVVADGSGNVTGGPSAANNVPTVLMVFNGVPTLVPFVPGTLGGQGFLNGPNVPGPIAGPAGPGNAIPQGVATPTPGGGIIVVPGTPQPPLAPTAPVTTTTSFTLSPFAISPLGTLRNPNAQ